MLCVCPTTLVGRAGGGKGGFNLSGRCALYYSKISSIYTDAETPLHISPTFRHGNSWPVSAHLNGIRQLLVVGERAVVAVVLCFIQV